MLDFLTPEVIEQLLNYPILIGTIVLCWFFYKIIIKLIEALNKKQKED